MSNTIDNARTNSNVGPQNHEVLVIVVVVIIIIVVVVIVAVAMEFHQPMKLPSCMEDGKARLLREEQQSNSSEHDGSVEGGRLPDTGY